MSIFAQKINRVKSVKSLLKSFISPVTSVNLILTPLSNSQFLSKSIIYHDGHRIRSIISEMAEFTGTKSWSVTSRTARNAPFRLA